LIGHRGTEADGERRGNGLCGWRVRDQLGEEDVQMPTEVAGQRGGGAADGSVPIAVDVSVLGDIDIARRAREDLGEGRGEPFFPRFPRDPKAVVHGSYVPS
jgi:hypothetical protein